MYQKSSVNSKFITFERSIPDHRTIFSLSYYCPLPRLFLIHSATVEGVHKEFQKVVRAGVCDYIPEKGVLMLISTDESSQNRANIIKDIYFRNLKQRVCI